MESLIRGLCESNVHQQQYYISHEIITNKRYMYQLMSTVKLPGSKRFDSQILMHSCAPKKDSSLDKEDQKQLSKDDC